MDKKQYTKLQHYIPVSYLKQFANCEGDNYFTCCYIKKILDIKKINIDKICAVHDLYELQINGKYVDRNAIEDSLIDLETRYAILCRQILSHIGRVDRVVLSGDELDTIKFFCALLIFRSKRSIDDLIGFCKSFLEYSLDYSKIREAMMEAAGLESEEYPITEDDVKDYVYNCYVYEWVFVLMRKTLMK